jgi:hypothetical protein
MVLPARFLSANLFAKKPEQKSQHGADHKASNHRKMKAKVVAPVMDISRQLSKPTTADARPNNQSDYGEEKAADKKKLSHIRHSFAP